MSERISLLWLVLRFSIALFRKLCASEKKYGWRGGWREIGWRPTLLHQIRTHVEKGDPRDVAAYCAFAWHHGWPVAEIQKRERGQHERPDLDA